jgi:uncharacterized OsmC-like protein
VHVTLVKPGNVKTDFTASRRMAQAAGGDPVYGAALTKAVGLMERDEANGVPAADVAAVVRTVLESRRPPRRVSVGKAGERAGLLAKRLLPFRAFEAAAKSSLGVLRSHQHTGWPGRPMIAGPGRCIVKHLHREYGGAGERGIRKMTTVTNGVNVQALLDAREVLKGAPGAAQFTWRASATWQNGVHSQIKVQSFFGLGEEQAHKQQAVFEADHPEVFAATDNGITPIEYLIVGLASCLTAGVASVAENRGIQLRSVTSTVEGAHDIRGILGADSDVRNGFNDIKVTFSIDADASKEDIEALVAQSQKRSAVFDALTNPTNVTVEVA